MTTLDEYLERAWADHADQSEAVAARLPEGLHLAADDDGVMRLTALAHHVYGEHLGRWQDGLVFVEALASRGIHSSEAQGSLARCKASLLLSGNLKDARAELAPSDQCRVTSMAACNLASRDVDRSTTHLNSAIAQALNLPDDDPAVRSLAVNCNGIAGSLQELSPLAEAQRDLMIFAAETARRTWERAGTWLEVERAEYRLALCWLAAGGPERAAHHARQCDRVVREHGSVPLEVFFAAEALALSSQALGGAAEHAMAVATASLAFEQLDESDKTWCRATLEKLTDVRTGAV